MPKSPATHAALELTISRMWKLCLIARDFADELSDFGLSEDLLELHCYLTQVQEHLIKRGAPPPLPGQLTLAED